MSAKVERVLARISGADQNLCGKLRPETDPYEVWAADGWTWYVLKKLQSPAGEAKNRFARWFCKVTSPFTTGDLGDVYVADLKRHGAVRIK